MNNHVIKETHKILVANIKHQVDEDFNLKNTTDTIIPSQLGICNFTIKIRHLFSQLCSSLPVSSSCRQCSVFSGCINQYPPVYLPAIYHPLMVQLNSLFTNYLTKQHNIYTHLVPTMRKLTDPNSKGSRWLP